MANSAMDHYASAKTSSRDENDRIKYAASCMKETRDEMQDYHTAILELDGSNPTSFFGVFDGHGGYNVALYCSKRFHLELVKDPDYENNPRTAIESVCFRIDKKLKISDKWKTFDDTPGPIKRNWLSRLKRAISQTFEPDNKGPQKEGSTACVALIRGNQIIVGNVGDSRCVLSRGGQAIDLSTDHKPDDPNERERIEAAGGKVVQDRVPKRDILTGEFCGTEPGIYRVDGGIAISRAIGYKVALYCSKRFHLELVNDRDYGNNLCTAIENVCFRIDKKLKISDKWKTFDDTPGPIKRNWLSPLKRAISQTFEPDNKGPQKEGSTACVALIRGNQIIVGNVGDSRCVLSRGGQAIDLSTDHKPDDPNERERIEAAGGKVVQDRVPKRDILTGEFCGTEPGIYRVDGGIAISRAIGYKVALYCSKRFHLELVNDRDYGNNLCTAIENVCFRIDKKLKISDKWKTFDDTPGPIKRNWLSPLKRAISQTFEPDNKGPQKEGSTACVALIRGNQVIVGNVGDSRCVLSRGGQAIYLSTDRKRDDSNEKERTEAAGGKVVQNRVPEIDISTGKFRGTELAIYRVDGEIAISRDIVDFLFKLNEMVVPAQERLTCTPNFCLETNQRTLYKRRVELCMDAHDKSQRSGNSERSINGKRKIDDGDTKGRKSVKIRNTVTGSLDGTPEEAARSIEESVIHILNWNKLYGTEVKYDNVIGQKASMFTTRPKGTFHYLLKYEKDGVNLIIDGYTGWCYGFVNSRGLWLFKPSDTPPKGYVHYIQHIGLSIIPAEAIYNEISPDSLIEKIQVGIKPFREACKDMSQYDGSTDEKVLKKLMISVGRVIFPVCEGFKFNQVCELNVSVIKSGLTTTIGESEKPETALYVKGWSPICTVTNSAIFNFLYCGVPMRPFSFNEKYGGIFTSAKDALKYINIAPYKSVNNRMCRRLQRVTTTWDRVDDGYGDEDVCLLGNVNLSKFPVSYQKTFKKETEFYLGRRAGGPAHWSVKEFLERRRSTELNPYRTSLLISYGPKVPSPLRTLAKFARVLRRFKL